MPERSYPWAGTLLGDAGRYAPNFYSVYLHSTIGLAEENPYRAPFAGGFNELAVAPFGVSMNITVESGTAFVAGKIFENTVRVMFPIAPNTSGLVRYDRVVLRRRVPEQTVRLALLSGLPGAGIPACTNIYGVQTEVSLAVITVASGAAFITAADIADERAFWRDRRLWLGVGDWEPDATTPASLVTVNLSGKEMRAWEFGLSGTDPYIIVGSAQIPAEWGDHRIQIFPFFWVAVAPLAAGARQSMLNVNAMSYGSPSAPVNLTWLGNAVELWTVPGQIQRVQCGPGNLWGRPGEELALSITKNIGPWIDYDYFLGLELVVRR